MFRYIFEIKEFMDDVSVKNTIAKNIAYYRKRSGYTQSELSEKLNYSDKSVSKWERGEGVPDVLVLMRMAELFGVTLNDLVIEENMKKPPRRRYWSRVFITLLSSGLSFLVAAVVFFILKMTCPEMSHAWLSFIFAIPVAGIVATVFSSMWFSNLWRLCAVSLIIWGFAVSVHLSFFLPVAAYIYIIGAVMQLLAILWFIYRSIQTKRS